jgi:hypothetical protein
MAARTFGFSDVCYPEIRRNQQSGPSLGRGERGGRLVTCARDLKRPTSNSGKLKKGGGGHTKQDVIRVCGEERIVRHGMALLCIVAVSLFVCFVVCSAAWRGEEYPRSAVRVLTV